MFDVAAYLLGKGLRGRPASGGRELMYPCFFDCGESPDSRKRKLYINVEDGVYNCKVCNASGGSYLLQKHFGDNPRQDSSDEPFVRRQILNWAADVGAEMLGNREDVLLYLLEERGLGAETIVERKLGFVGDGWSLTGSLPADFTRDQLATTGLVHRDGPRAGRDFFTSQILLPIMHRGNVVAIRGRAWGQARGGKYMSGPGEVVRGFNLDSLDGAEEVILTEGEFDAMRLHEVLSSSGEDRARRIAVVGLPGTNAIPDDLDSYLADVKRIFIGFDADESGKIATEKLRDRYGPRARALELPTADGKGADWSDYLLPAKDDTAWRFAHPFAGHTASDVLQLMSAASGKRIFSMAEAGASFRSHREVHGGLKTGYRQLDAVIEPGLLPGQVVFVLAKTGTGKTLVLCNLAYNMRRHRILFVSLEMTREEVYHRLERIYYFHHPDATAAELEYALSTIWICDENRLAEKDLQELVSEYEIENGVRPDVVMVDYLGYYARGFKGNSPYEKTTNAAMQLKADAKAGRLVMISPAQVNRGSQDGKPLDLDDARDSGAIEETGDFVLSVYRPEAALSPGQTAENVRPSGTLRMSILKSRHGGVGRTFSLAMDLLTLAIVDAESPQAKIVEDHNYKHWRSLTWDELRAQQRAPRQLVMGGR